MQTLIGLVLGLLDWLFVFFSQLTFFDVFSYEKFKAPLVDENNDGKPDTIDLWVPPNFPWVSIVDNLVVLDQPFNSVRNGNIRTRLRNPSASTSTSAFEDRMDF